MASVPPSLLDFTRECLSQGIDRTEIRQALMNAGWTEREATAALGSFAESPLPVPVPKKRVSSGPREAFLHLLALFLLYMAAFSTGAILFLTIDVFIKDPANRNLFNIGGFARFNAAALIASLPVLALVRRAIMRDVIRNPGTRIAPVVRTLAYITLLVTSLIMVCDMVSVLAGFLNGDLTLTFILKSGVVLLLAGGIFLWYISGLSISRKNSARSKQQECSSMQESLWRPRLALGRVFHCFTLPRALALMDCRKSSQTSDLFASISQRVAQTSEACRGAIRTFLSKKKNAFLKSLERIKDFS